MKIVKSTQPTDQWGGGRVNVAILLPDSYDQNAAALYPVIYNFNGVGQAGSNFDQLFTDGLLKHIKATGKDLTGKMPDGTVRPFIVIAAQGGGWTLYPNAMQYVLKGLEAMKLKIDPDYVFADGLSSGGVGSVMHGGAFPQVKAVTSLSTGSPEYGIQGPLLANLARRKTPVAFVAGEHENPYRQNGEEKMLPFINVDGNKSAFFVPVKGAWGHQGPGWSTFYNGTVKIDGLPFTDWMLREAARQVGQVPEEPKEPEAPQKDRYTMLKVDPANVAKAVLLMKDGTFKEMPYAELYPIDAP
jgi:hypothetical protein